MKQVRADHFGQLGREVGQRISVVAREVGRVG